MIDLARRIGVIDKLLHDKFLNELALREEPSSENLFWVMKQIYNKRLPLDYNDRGYSIRGGRFQQQWMTTDGRFSSTNGAIRIKVIHPTKIEGFGVSSILGWENTPESRNTILSNICVVDLSRQEGQQRIGDLSTDEIRKTPRGSKELDVVNFAVDGNDDEFGLNTGVLTPTPVEVIKSTYGVIRFFLKDGHLPPNLHVPQLT